MGVMACDRYECEHIMCNRCILDHTMYICDWCYDELVAYRKTWPDEMTISEVRDRIEQFMRTRPGTSNPTICNIDEEFEKLTGYSLN